MKRVCCVLHCVCINIWWLRENHQNDNVSCHWKRCTSSCSSPVILLLHALRVPRQYSDVRSNRNAPLRCHLKGTFSRYSSWVIWLTNFVTNSLLCGSDSRHFTKNYNGFLLSFEEIRFWCERCVYSVIKLFMIQGRNCGKLIVMLTC